MSEPAEDLFECFCVAQGLLPARIPTASNIGEKRPDYRVVGHDATVFVVEVKAVTPNSREAEQIAHLYAGKGGISWHVEPGAKVRELIAKANSQLKAVTAGQQPGVLAIFNLEPVLGHHTEPYAILTAMRGLDEVPVLVPKDPSEPPMFQEVRSGPKKRMTPRDNTTISAILLPDMGLDGIWIAEIFHNRHAACPLPVGSLRGAMSPPLAHSG